MPSDAVKLLRCPHCGATAGTPEWVKGVGCRILTVRCVRCGESFQVDIEED